MADDPIEAAEADEDDPIVEECIRDALAPYLRVFSPEELADHRAFLTVFIKTHPAAAPLYERLRKRRVASASGDVPRERPLAAPARDEGSTEVAGRLNGTSNGRRK